MVALHSGTKVLAIFPSAFSELVDRLMPDLEHRERIGFKSIASTGVSFLRQEDLPKVPKWEALFLERLGQQIAEVGHLLAFNLNDSEEIERYLPDLLEGFRGNRIGEFAFHFDQVQDTSAQVLTLQAYDAPSTWQRLTRAERPARQRVVLRTSDIIGVVGTSLEMEIKTKNGSIRLTQDGSIVKSQ